MSAHPILPVYLRIDTGERTTRDDPKRGVWYASRSECGFWTDDWSTLRRAPGGGPPVSPCCGAVGFQTTAAKWLDGAQRYEDEGHPHYLAFVRWTKERCGRGEHWNRRFEAFARAQGGADT